MKTYKIVRYCFMAPKRVIKYGLSLGEARRHCQSNASCGVDKAGFAWFDGYTESKRRGRPGGLGI